MHFILEYIFSDPFEGFFLSLLSSKEQSSSSSLKLAFLQCHDDHGDDDYDTFFCQFYVTSFRICNTFSSLRRTGSGVRVLLFHNFFRLSFSELAPSCLMHDVEVPSLDFSSTCFFLPTFFFSPHFYFYFPFISFLNSFTAPPWSLNNTSSLKIQRGWVWCVIRHLFCFLLTAL